MSDDSRAFEHEESRQETHDLEDISREERDDVADEEESRANNEDEDNDDEEEDDEEDDEDDRVGSRKRSRLERNRFLDVEAEVSDDDEDEDEDEDDLTKEGFIAADHENEAEAIRRDDRLHRQVDRSHEKSTEEDAQRLAAQFKERYGRTNKYRGDESGFVSQRFLLPSINDPSIWAIRCRQGKEKEIVRKLLQKKLTLEGKPNALQILSVFQRDNFTNYIYIEAEKLTAVDSAIKGFADIYASQKLKVPVEEYPDLLRVSKTSEVKVEPGSYVRIKRGTYKGDLAIVDAIEENGLEVTLQIVPRLDYKRELDDSGKRKRTTSNFRPPQRLFSRKDALENDPGNIIVRTANTFTYRGEEYIDGFLYKLFKLQFLETQNVTPKLEEVAKFNTGDSDQLDLTSIAQSLKATKTVVFNTGDRVQVLKGEQQGLQGDVISASTETAILKPRDFNGENLEIPINHLRKIFNEGDHVSVLNGRHAGHTGIVVSVENNQVTFISDQSKKDITVFANHLTKSDDSSTLIDGAYALHDLVRINQTAVGVVINADKDIFTVLSQDGKILSLAPSAIISKVDIRKDQAFAADSNGDPIKIGDTVKENHGFKRQGSILHIYRSILFVYSKETTENSGIFASTISSVSNIASKTSQQKESTQLDLTKMNPKLKNGGVMAPPSLPTQQTGRDRTINQHVSIRMGEYKGLRGIVKDANGDIARVELHTKNKILNIAKQKLSFVVGKDLVPYDEFIKNRSGFRNTGPSFSSTPSGSSSSHLSGNVSHWASSSLSTKSSGWQGSTTAGTAYGGSGTSWGGATNHGNGTSWGSGTAYGNSTGAGTAWGNPNNGGGTSWGQSVHGGQQSSWGSGAGNASSYGATSQWGNAGSNTNYGGASQWGQQSSYGRPQQGWAAETPGSYQSAETPGANYAQTPGANYQS